MGKPVECDSHSTKPWAKPGDMCWTTSTGTEKSFGNPARMVCRASGPPVEAPIATTLAGKAPEGTGWVSRVGADAAIRVERGHRFTTLTSDISLTVPSNSLTVESWLG